MTKTTDAVMALPEAAAPLRPSHGYVNGDARMTSSTKSDGHAVDGATGSGMFP
ncbi:hypothetical protein [Streptomyces sp. HC307]|uniref:hypothetical protein n=1 Tax=Streptomyces flavusporus TaxID=3385496 RepID=UPI0039174795